MDKILFILDDLATLLIWVCKAVLLCAIFALPFILDAVAQIYFDLPPDHELKP